MDDGDDAVGLSFGKVNFIVVVDINDRVNHSGTRTPEYEPGQIWASRNCLIRRGLGSASSIIRCARSKVTSTESNVSFCFTANDIVTQMLWLLLHEAREVNAAATDCHYNTKRIAGSTLRRVILVS
jgi:hypothetical protein